MFSDPDYYQLLGLTPGASADDIRRAYRALAFTWHPDKNPDPAASVRFTEIHAAYAVLKDPVKRAEYNYRRYTANPAYRAKPAAIHTADVLREARALYEKTHRLDPFRIDHDRLAFETGLVITPHNITLLTRETDISELITFFSYLQPAFRLLPFEMALRLSKELEPLAARHNTFSEELVSLLRELRWRHYWSRYKIWAALGIAMLFCLLLYLAGR
jgi:curved DNA-binding protein CbpA